MHAIDCPKPTMASLFLQSLRMQLALDLGPGIGMACRDVDGDPHVLWPAESTAILKAVPRRQREYAAGRIAAREAMIQIGWPAGAIPSAPDRSPAWPQGVVGSITHSSQACIAIAGRRDQVHAMGIDLEEDRPVDPALWETICTPRELVDLASVPRSNRGRWMTRLFCAKEAFYKWQYPQTGRMLDFCDVRVTLNRDHLGFFVHPAVTGNAPLLSCEREGRLLTTNGMVLAWLIGPPISSMRTASPPSAPAPHSWTKAVTGR